MTRPMTRGFLPLLAVVMAAGLAAFAWATEGFQIITGEGARRLAAEHYPRPLPDAGLLDQDGHAFSLADYRGRRILVDFIYTRCPSLCSLLGDDFHRALAMDRGIATSDGIDLLSISFDLENDDREALQLYGARYGAAPPRWRIAVPADKDGLARLLQAFGVVVIPDGIGGFVHDGAVYLVDRRGRLARILDPDTALRLSAPALRAASP